MDVHVMDRPIKLVLIHASECELPIGVRTCRRWLERYADFVRVEQTQFPCVICDSWDRISRRRGALGN